MSDTWEAVRVLDDAENWAERNAVLFKEDHAELVQLAKDIVHDLVNNLPISDAKLECQKVDNFSEEFSSVLFDVDYLESLKMESNSDSNSLSRDSIYVKFDPLVNKVSHKAHVASEVPDKRDLLGLDTPPHYLKRFQPIHIEDYPETSVFSPVAEAVPTNNHNRSMDHPSATCMPVSHVSNEDLSPIPVTSSLVKVLKYSDEDLNKLAQLARRRANLRERQEMETQILKLKEMIAAAQYQLQSHHEQIYVLDSTRFAHLLHTDRIKEERRRMKERAVLHSQSIRERLSSYQELQEWKNGFELYQALLAKDQAQLENAFDELHSCYVKQKETNKRLVKQVEEIETYLTEVREWHRQASEKHNALIAAKEAVNEELKQKCQAMQNEHEMKLAVERTKTKKLQLKMTNLQEDLLLVKQDKQQLTQICDDLMKQLELNTRET